MTDIDVSQLIARLAARREAVEATLASLEDARRPVALDQTLQGRLSRMDALGQQQIARSSEGHLRTELARIKAALERHVSGRYGACCRCRLPVEPSRLNADPAAPLCLSCIDELAEERGRTGSHAGAAR
jgi:DnaK suppressor protein